MTRRMPSFSGYKNIVSYGHFRSRLDFKFLTGFQNPFEIQQFSVAPPVPSNPRFRYSMPVLEFVSLLLCGPTAFAPFPSKRATCHPKRFYRPAAPSDPPPLITALLSCNPCAESSVYLVQ